MLFIVRELNKDRLIVMLFNFHSLRCHSYIIHICTFHIWILCDVFGINWLHFTSFGVSVQPSVYLEQFEGK